MSMSVTFYKPDLYKKLDEKYEIFSGLRDVVMFMAVLGYIEGEPKRQDFRGSGDEQGNTRIESFYNRDLYRVFGASLAYQDTGSPDSLVDLELQAELISQYAAGGLELFQQELSDVAGDPTDAILNYIDSLVEDSDGSEQTILKRIQENFNNDMVDSEST
jgi:hypothetical protein